MNDSPNAKDRRSGNTNRHEPFSKRKDISRIRTQDHDRSRLSTCKTTTKQSSKDREQHNRQAFLQLERCLTIEQLAEIKRRRQLEKHIRMFQWQQYREEQNHLIEKEHTLEEDWRQIRKQSMRLARLLKIPAEIDEMTLDNRNVRQRSQLLQRMTELYKGRAFYNPEHTN